MTTSSNGRLAGKVAIVTGGGSGIGLATARRFAAEGARVMLGDIDADRLATAQTELGDAVAGQRCDVRVESEVEALVAATIEQFGSLHIAFANAGVGSFGRIVDVDRAEWMRVIEVNLLGPLLTVKHAARHMHDGGGSIILTASLNAVQAGEGMSAYCCSKAALAMLAQVAAMELGPERIRVNAIGPGLVRTNLSEPMWMVPGIVEDFDANAPLATTTKADDVASLVTFLASDEASSISGTLQLVDRAAHTKRYPDMLGHIDRATSRAGRPTA
jgi:NAD(P)-dependent dehydrogenase (short-subunit alcohol dehydrogenase family)